MTYLRFFNTLMMKSVVLFGCVVLLLSCSDDDGADVSGNWTKLATPSTSVRSGAVSFVLKGKGYFGLGYNGTESNAKGYKTDFWSFNGSVWDNDIKAFPGTPREQAVAFVLNDKLYVGLGYTYDTDELLRDFWMYNPDDSSWTPIGNFPIALKNAVAFVVDNRAFVGTGRKADDNWENRFWELTQGEAPFWPDAPYTTIPGDLREGAFAFVINSTAYVGGGVNNSTYQKDMYLFTPSQDAAMKGYILNNNSNAAYYADFATAVGRAEGVVFVQDGIAYIATGNVNTASLSSVYAYNPKDESWRRKTDFEGSARTSTVGFVCNNRMILGSGISGSVYYNDFWEFKPNDPYDNLN